MKAKHAEAMKLALEALHHCKDVIVERGLNGNPEFAEKWGLTLPIKRSEEAITALRAALAEQPAQQEPGRNHWEDGDIFERIAAMKNQPAQQEPVGALILGGVVDTSDGPEYEEWDIEWNHKAIESLQERLVTHNPVTLNIYTSPPAQRTWVSLTDEDIEFLRHDLVIGRNDIKAIDAKLREKNAQPSKPLTDEQIAEMMMQTWGCASIAPRHAPAFARAIEAAHGITGKKK